jgi:phage-related minor tail protein
MATLKDLVANLRLDTSGFSKGLRGMSSKLKMVGSTMKAATAGLVSAIKGELDSADEMSKAAQKFGVPIESLSKLKHAADMSGVSFETLGTGLRKLSQNMALAAGGNKKAAAMFKDIGVSAVNADGSLRSTEEVMQDVADVMAKMPDGAAKTALAMDIFGKSGAEMVPMLNGGKKALQQMAEEAASLGIVFDAKTGKAAENFNDDLARIKGALGGLVVQLAASLAPTLEYISKRLVEATMWFRDLSPATKELAAMFATVAIAAGPLLIGLGTIIMPLKAVALTMKAISLAALANPFVLIGLAAVAAGATIYYYWEPIKAFFADLWEGIKTRAQAAWDGIKTMASDAVSSVANAWSGIREYFGVVLSNIKMAFVDGWEAIKAEVSTWPARFLEIGGQIVDGLRQGIADKWNGMIDDIKSWGESLPNWMKKVLGIASPSRVFKEIGRNITEGLAIGIKDRQPLVDGAMDRMGQSISGKGKSLADRMEEFKSAAQGAFSSFVTRSQTARQALSQLASSLASTLANKAFNGIWGALFGGGGGGGGTGSFGLPMPFAKGGVFSSGRVQAFAKGTVVSGATAFAMSGGLGVMGEAGPEAIMPLVRGADGKLGVASQGGGTLTISLADGLKAQWLHEAGMQTVNVMQTGAAMQQAALGQSVQSLNARGVAG